MRPVFGSREGLAVFRAGLVGFQMRYKGSNWDAAGQKFRKWSILRARIRCGAVGRLCVRSFVIDSMGLSLRVLEGDLMAAVIGSINVDGGKGGTDVSGR
jgi:hypothetical protein